MSVTKRFIILICAGIPGLALCVFFGIHTLFFLLYNMLCMGLLIIDFFVSPTAEAFEVNRQERVSLYFKTENALQIKVKNMANRPVKIEIKDDIPDRHFKVSRKAVPNLVLPGQETLFEYMLIPSKRGSYLFRSIFIRYTGYLGLCQKFAAYAQPVEYKVYPDLRDMGRYRLFALKKHLAPTGRRLIAKQGNANEFESLREYVEGDDYRKINWMTTARERKLMVNQYEPEKNQPVYMMIDAGRSMGYCVNGYKKLDHAITAALILADIVNQNGDMSGLFVFDKEVKASVPPGKGQAHRNALMEALYHIEDTKSTSNYEQAFLSLHSRQKRRSIVFIFTDFETLEEAQELTENISLFKRRHIPIVVLMKNESLQEMADQPIGSMKEAFNRGLALEFLDERKSMIKALHAAGVFCIESTAENFSLSLVNEYLSVRQI